MRAGILDLVTEQVARRPSAEAIRAGDRALTYRELAARSRAIARKLDAMGIGPESAVGLCVESSPAMVVGALGILEAGAAYVPMDPSHPQARLATIAREAGVQVILETSTIENGAEPDLAAAPERSIEPTTLAYVIFTSGSTGRPKGVEVEHGSLSNLVDWHLRAFEVTESDALWLDEGQRVKIW